MKSTFAILALAVWSAYSLQAGPETLVKQRAKDVRDQQNTRQGVPPPTAPQAAPKPAEPQRTAAKPNPTAKLRADITAWQSQNPVKPEAKKEFTQNLLSAVRGSKGPSAATVEKFAASLSGALAGKTLGPTELSRLVSNINLAVNSSGLSVERTDEIAAEVQADLESAGVTQAAAAGAVNDLKAVMAELSN